MSKISEYPAATTTADESEIVVAVQNGVTKKMTLAQANALRQMADGRFDELKALTGPGYINIKADGSLEAASAPGAGIFEPIGTADAAIVVHDADPLAHDGVAASFAAHDGAGGTGAHPIATDAEAGFCPVISTKRRDSLRGDMVFSDELFMASTFKTAGTHALGSEKHIVANATAGAVTLNLPAITVNNDGKEHIISRFDAVVVNAVTINANGTQTIVGSASKTLDAQYQAIRLTAVFIDSANSYWAIS